MSWLLRLDHQLFLLINTRFGSKLMDSVFEPLSYMSSWPVVFVAVALLVGKGRKALMIRLAYIVLGLAVTVPLLGAVRNAVDRQRPRTFFAERVERGELELRLLERHMLATRSFPSGHTALTFFLLAYAGCWNRAQRLWALLLAAAMGFSRVYVGQHFPSDVIGGALLGSGAGYALFRVEWAVEPWRQRWLAARRARSAARGAGR